MYSRTADKHEKTEMKWKVNYLNDNVWYIRVCWEIIPLISLFSVARNSTDWNVSKSLDLLHHWYQFQMVLWKGTFNYWQKVCRLTAIICWCAWNTECSVRILDCRECAFDQHSSMNENYVKRMLIHKNDSVLKYIYSKWNDYLQQDADKKALNCNWWGSC